MNHDFKTSEFPRSMAKIHTALRAAIVTFLTLFTGSIIVFSGTTPGRTLSKRAISRYYGTFTNSIADMETPDPFVVSFNGNYYMTYTTGENNIQILCSSSLQDFHNNVISSTIVFQTSSLTNVWAPELHSLDGNWWIYFSASDSTGDPSSHRIYVLEGPSSSESPTLYTYTWQNVVANMPDKFSIDPSIFTLDGTLFLVYSTWPDNTESPLVQELWITQLSSPGVAVAGTSARLTTPSLSTEFYTDPSNGETHAICEGPYFYSSSQWQGIIYSTGASWSDSYGLNTITFTGGNPLSESSWVKSTTPLLASSETAGPWSPGHACVVMSPSGDETYLVFHASPQANTGWNGRMAWLQQMDVSGGGNPTIAQGIYPVGTNTALEIPS